jgi:site-specific recombinase XerD
MNARKRDEIFRKLARDPRLKSVNTQRTYLLELQAFEKWRGDRPISNALVEEYLAGLRLAGKSPGTVVRKFYALRWWFKNLAETPGSALTPQEAEAIIESAAEAACAREVWSEPDPAETHLTQSELWRVVKACLSDPTPAGKRDAALIMLASKKGIRLEDVTGLDFADFAAEGEQEGRLIIRRNMDPIKIIHIGNFTFCALTDWLAIRGTLPGPLFCGVDNRGKIIHRYLACETVRLALNKRLKQAGVRHLTWSELSQS